MYHLAVTGRCVNHRSAIGNNTYMAAYYNNISCPQIGKTGNLLILSNTAPAGGGQITLTDSNLIQTPVYKTGTVKCIWPLSAPYIRTAQLGAGYRNQSAGTSAGCSCTGNSTTSGGASAGIAALAGTACAGSSVSSAGGASSPGARRRFLGIAAGQLCHRHGAYGSVCAEAVGPLEGFYCILRNLTIIASCIS